MSNDGTCTACGGTGKRNAPAMPYPKAGRPRRAVLVTIDCESCDGTGRKR